MMYTDDELSELISCAKRIAQAPKKEMRAEGQMQRNEMELESLDGKHSFRVFMRQSLQFAENFSIGLDYAPKGGPGGFCLLRCNGMHGGHKVHPHHSHCHIHRSKAEDINAGLRAERHIEATTEYAAFRDALRFFLLRVNLQSSDLSQYFPGIAQSDLFDGEGQS